MKRRLGTVAAAALVLSLAAHGATVAQAKAPSATAQSAGPLSDADGDGLPDAWESPAASTAPVSTISPTNKDGGGKPQCKPAQRLRKGKCAPKCKKGHRLKRGKCVKKKKKKARKKGKARISSVAPGSLASLGADPNHKDIFVQVNYANETIRQSMSCSELDKIVAAFASAPVGNPDGTTGINLHIDAGISCPSRSYNLGGSAIFSAGACPGTGATFLSNELPESRIGAFHLAGFSPTCGGGGGEGGAATLNGTEMVVFTGGPSFAHVLMHELGHNLGLDHPLVAQPNRFSSMNTRLYASNTGSSVEEVLDYQRFNVPALDENNLSEVEGVSAPPEAHRFFVLHFCLSKTPVVPGEGFFADAWPGDGSIDWNCNSPEILLPGELPTIDPGTFAVDVNNDGQLSVFPATGNEWLALNYASGGQIGP